MTGKKRPIDPDVEAQLRAAGDARNRLRAEADDAETQLVALVRRALADGASVRVVAEVAGLAVSTVAKWKAAP